MRKASEVILSMEELLLAEELQKILYLSKSFRGSFVNRFYYQKSFRSVFINPKTSKVSYLQKSCRYYLICTRALDDIVSIKKLQWVPYLQIFSLLQQDFYHKKSFRRSPIYRRASESLLRADELQKILYLSESFRGSFVCRFYHQKSFRRVFINPKASKVSYLQKSFRQSLICTRSLDDIISIKKLQRVLYLQILSLKKLSKSFYQYKSFQMSFRMSYIYQKA